jgi:hypothetical protein
LTRQGIIIVLACLISPYDLSRNSKATIIMTVLHTQQRMFKPRCCLCGLAGWRSRTSSGSMYMHLSPPRHVFVSIALHSSISNPPSSQMNSRSSMSRYVARGAMGGSSRSTPGRPVTGVVDQGGCPSPTLWLSSSYCHLHTALRHDRHGLSDPNCSCQSPIVFHEPCPSWHCNIRSCQFDTSRSLPQRRPWYAGAKDAVPKSVSLV